MIVVVVIATKTPTYLSASCALGTSLGASHVLTHSILTVTEVDISIVYDTHFTDEEIEVQESLVVCS